MYSRQAPSDGVVQGTSVAEAPPRVAVDDGEVVHLAPLPTEPAFAAGGNDGSAGPETIRGHAMNTYESNAHGPTVAGPRPARA